MQIQLPKLRKININRNKKKIFILTDDMYSSSGVGTMAKELIYGTCNQFDWVQLAAALNHPDHGRVLDLSENIEKETGFEDLYVKQYKHNGYFSYDAFFQILEIEKPDAVMLFTDPRHYMEFWPHEHTIRSEYKIPIIYWSIWDSELIPHWNEPYYKSCDLLLAINKQTHVIHNTLSPNTITRYVPHGINSNTFFPITNVKGSKTYEEFKELERDFKTKHNVDFIVFWNSRNIRRKQPGDVILGFKLFCDSLPKEQAERCCLFMKTHVQDPNGTDLMAVKNRLCPNYKVIFNEENISSKVMNYFYNLANVTVSLSSAEGFGLSTAESLMAGTPIIAPVHGGLQDQMGFVDDSGVLLEVSNSDGKFKKSGKWVQPLYPRAKQLQGSIPTPYIFDYVCDADDLNVELQKAFKWQDVDTKTWRGMQGREWMISKESKLSHNEMNAGFIDAVNTLFETWQPKARFTINKITK
jgi:glycosyltransferase involved in cell wall biosynthesis